ncbi:MAG: hypothetical protein M0P71_17020 [Melioribacteraceae bacterium]|jgi:hypothetical protein|nr:hypothetical protein [Melioribacteraceae bacterium]
MTNLQHTYIKQKNFAPGPTKPKEELINRPLQLQHGTAKQTFPKAEAASGILNTKITE